MQLASVLLEMAVAVARCVQDNMGIYAVSGIYATQGKGYTVI